MADGQNFLVFFSSLQATDALVAAAAFVFLLIRHMAEATSVRVVRSCQYSEYGIPVLFPGSLGSKIWFPPGTEIKI